MPDSAELIAGTTPTDPASVLKLQARASSGAMVLNWPSVNGRNYNIQFNPAVTGGVWQSLTNNVQGNGGALQVMEPFISGVNRFYRLGVTKN